MKRVERGLLEALFPTPVAPFTLHLFNYLHHHVHVHVQNGYAYASPSSSPVYASQPIFAQFEDLQPTRMAQALQPPIQLATLPLVLNVARRTSRTSTSTVVAAAAGYRMGMTEEPMPETWRV